MDPSEHDCLHWQADMDSLPVGWTLHACDQEGDSSGLLRGADPDSGAVTHLCDLFHEDAQVGNRTIGNKNFDFQNQRCVIGAVFIQKIVIFAC